jgi:tetratricopeptide (TPR) repeat protein
MRIIHLLLYGKNIFKQQNYFSLSGKRETDAPGMTNEEGEQMMEKTILSISPDAHYFFQRAMEEETRNNPPKVLEYFNQAIASEPGYATAWNEKANFLDLMGKFDEALTCYDTALKIAPGDAEIWFNKGLTLKKMGKEQDAESCISHGIDLAIG